MLFNRDLSWLGFNHLVLQQGRNPRMPLYEQLKFLAIFSSNLDEFFRVRYPVIVAFSKLGEKTVRKFSLFPKQEGIPEKVQEVIGNHLDEFGDILLHHIIPQLKQENIFFYYNSRIHSRHQTEIRDIFLSEVLSFIRPIQLNVASSIDFFPENNQLYLVVTVRRKEDESLRHLIINIPSDRLKRFYQLSELDGMRYVIFIDDIIRENLDLLFPGEVIEGAYSIKLNRDAAVDWDQDFNPEMLDKLEKKLAKRDHGIPSRFLYEHGMPANLRFFLAAIFQINLDEMFEGGRYHNMSDLHHFPEFEKRLSFPEFTPVVYPPESFIGDIFKAALSRDILLHVPYQDYSPVLRFFNQAAIDPLVTEIYITLYRVAADSHIVNALISAARNGKKVMCFIELKARFDEGNNIKWSRMMREAGVQLLYSSAHTKVHSKVALVKRGKNETYEDFSVVSTGNFNETTAKFYCDHVMITSRPEIAKELSALFQYLKQRKPVKDQSKPFDLLKVTRFNMIPDLEKLIRREIKKVENGGKGLIRIKVNNLEDPWIIGELYKAGMRGVEVQLIVRSVCCLVPGKHGANASIKVRRIVDRFLEHSRIFIFGEGEDTTVWMGSSDLMIRNLRRRIEVMLTVQDKRSSKELTDYFDMQWRDDTQAVWLDESLNNVRIEPAGSANAQADILTYLQNAKND